jgi:hypothetical protein
VILKKNSQFELYNTYFCAMAKKNTDKVVFHQIKVLDAGAKAYR